MLGMNTYLRRVKPRNANVYGIDKACISAGYSMCATVDSRAFASKEDYKRGERLGRTPIGAGKDKFLRFIHVDWDWELPRYMWQEVDTYHFLERNSQSTMHRITKMNIETACGPYTSSQVIDNLKVLIDQYNRCTTEEERAVAWLKLKANVSEGLMLTSRVSANYATLKTMYTQRRYHRNPEWRIFCRWVETLPKAIALGVTSVSDWKTV